MENMGSGGVIKILFSHSLGREKKAYETNSP